MGKKSPLYKHYNFLIKKKITPHREGRFHPPEPPPSGPCSINHDMHDRSFSSLNYWKWESMK